MMGLAERHGGSLVAVRRVAPHEVQRYGVIKPGPAADSVMRVLDLVETPKDAFSTWAIVGRYVISPEVFAVLADLPPERNGEIQLTDALRTLGLSHPLFACELAGRHYDVGNRLGYLKANVEFGLRREDIGGAFAVYLSELHSAMAETAAAEDSGSQRPGKPERG